MGLQALPDVLAVQIFSFLSDQDLACASNVTHWTYDKCNTTAFDRLKKAGCVAPNDSLSSLQGLHRLHEINSNFSDTLINGIGGVHHLFHAQKLSWYTNSFTTAFFRGKPIAWGKMRSAFHSYLFTSNRKIGPNHSIHATSGKRALRARIYILFFPKDTSLLQISQISCAAPYSS